MSMHHVLPSDAAPKTYPNNSPASYSTPLQNPYDFKGNWEVALMSATHSGCINTFDNDVLTLSRYYSTSAMLKKTPKPIRIILIKRTLKDIVNEVNRKLKGILRVKLILKDTHCKWEMIDDKFCLAISPEIQKAFKLWEDVITTYDSTKGNYYDYPSGYVSQELSMKEQAYVMLVPVTYNGRKIVLKESNEQITPEVLLERFNERVKIAGLRLDGRHFIASKHCSTPHCDASLLLFSEALLKVMSFRKGGMFQTEEKRYFAYDFTRGFKEEWSVTEIKLDEVYSMFNPIGTDIVLSPQSFRRHEDAVKYLNTLNEALEFSCNTANELQLQIKEENMTVTFSDTLRDIFGFDRNVYKGKGSHAASGSFSLARRISYLYIYSNISKHVRIGDTEAPLLGIIPFESGECHMLKEKTFEDPVYVPVRSDHISQIDILICDGAGDVVPFMHEAITILRIHFRKV